nr:uncharacterized protein LOC128685087 [Cherax quadricarinatus]
MVPDNDGWCAAALRLLLLLLALSANGWSLRVSGVQVPPVVVSGSTVKLECKYHHSTDRPDPLYSVKWYRDVNQFYEYIPRRKPPIRVYPLPYINVDVRKRRGARNFYTYFPTTLKQQGSMTCSKQPNVPLSPISSGIGRASHRLAEILAKNLAKLLGKINKAHLQHSGLLYRVRDYNIKNKKLASFVVTALLTNVLTDQALDLILRKVNDDLDSSHRAKILLTWQNFAQILTIIFEEHIKQFGLAPDRAMWGPRGVGWPRTRGGGREVVVARCQRGHSDPPADIYWTINWEEAPPLAHHRSLQMDRRGERVQVSELQATVTEEWLARGAMVLTCHVQVSSVYYRTANVTLVHADWPQPAEFGWFSSGKLEPKLAEFDWFSSGRLEPQSAEFSWFFSGRVEPQSAEFSWFFSGRVEPQSAELGWFFSGRLEHPAC